MTEARTTVVIATRDRAPELARTLAELHVLRPRPPVLVLDNASRDDTAARAAEFPGVRVVRLRRNLGATARNLGVALAETPYVAFSDDDSWWAPDALPLAEKLLDEHPRAGLLAAQTLVGPEHRPDEITEALESSPLGRSADLPGPSVLGFLACSAVVRVHAFRAAGGFSPVLHFGAEERLLSYDLAAAGWGLCYVAALKAHHHPSTLRAPGKRSVLEARNNALITWMRRPWPAGFRAAAGLLTEPRALAGALWRLPKALARRRKLPSEVERQIGMLER
ncbi:Glycosyltransferase, GT2 family [Amycolatopsis xylanica]|uniref:Glycosyltransferase, GT2 family n=1 Tax=Amycolatopsis xylanica TaxID=589385 RepID=A0A1H3S9F4_9PSEU|nr:glycosyltransferase [Amycolatopsis xylanica]SDZ34733.1 Glycosyltransferase, GT2 family [Amycolatopsis xylanica]